LSWRSPNSFQTRFQLCLDDSGIVIRGFPDGLAPLCRRDARLQAFAVSSLADLYDRAYIQRLSAGGPDPEIDPYSEEERDRIIEAFRMKRGRFFVFVFFQFWTGARTSGAAARRWGAWI
jgi:hypothetical protein